MDAEDLNTLYGILVVTLISIISASMFSVPIKKFGIFLDFLVL